MEEIRRTYKFKVYHPQATGTLSTGSVTTTAKRWEQIKKDLLNDKMFGKTLKSLGYKVSATSVSIVKYKKK